MTKRASTCRISTSLKKTHERSLGASPVARWLMSSSSSSFTEQLYCRNCVQQAKLLNQVLLELEPEASVSEARGTGTGNMQRREL